MTKSRPTPAISLLLAKDEDGSDRKHSWNCRTLTGMLSYLQFTTGPDISMATHQCARFNNCPKLSHERAVKQFASIFSPPRTRASSSDQIFPGVLSAMFMQLLLEVGPVVTAISLRLCCPGLATSFLTYASSPPTGPVSVRQGLRSALLRLNTQPCP